jgi:hypothetical protein
MRGRSTVVVTSHPLPELAVSVSLAGLKETHPVAAENLFVIHIDPIEAVNNDIRQNIPGAILVQAVLASGIYRSLVEVAPGLKEIAFLNRLYRLTEDRHQDGRKFDHVVWDAPATGHFIQMLRVARNFEAYLSGPFALLGARIAKFSADPGRFRIVPVTTLEEMATRETVEMCQQLKADLGLEPKTVFCNMTSPLANSDTPTDQLVSRLRNDSAEDLRFLASRREIESRILARLRGELTANVHMVRRAPSGLSGVALLLHLAGQLETMPEYAA